MKSVRSFVERVFAIFPQDYELQWGNATKINTKLAFAFSSISVENARKRAYIWKQKANRTRGTAPDKGGYVERKLYAIPY